MKLIYKGELQIQKPLIFINENDISIDTIISVIQHNKYIYTKYFLNACKRLASKNNGIYTQKELTLRIKNIILVSISHYFKINKINASVFDKRLNNIKQKAFSFLKPFFIDKISEVINYGKILF